MDGIRRSGRASRSACTGQGISASRLRRTARRYWLQPSDSSGVSGLFAYCLPSGWCSLSVWLPMLPNRGPAKSFAQIARPLNDKRSWVLSLYYFLTFGGFVAMAVYLPTLLTEVFKLTPQYAGFRTAGFVVLATLLRPVVGVLADKIGGRAILKWAFPATAVFAI